jgi:antitoxin component YwqK of YwqJK toxin-antitoxin module
LYNVHNVKPNGNVKIYSEKGNLYIEREYSNGDWVKSIESPVSANWSFNQAKAELTIRDLENGKRYAGGTTIIEIMLGLNNDYDIYKDILDKSTYENVFKINGKPFTGQLVGLNYTPAPDSVKSFELDFKNGKLHGDIKLFEEYFGLTLHEKFESGELTETVYVMNPEEMDGMAKPIIYFYPENTTELVVKLNIDGRLTHTYPKYEDEWKVTAHPDGTLFDENGKEYYALYWEGENDKPFTLNEGAVVKGENTVAFLEESLETLGLNRREANEFIMYWMPQMENNAYNLIHFSTAEYEEIAQLDIEPKPETIIRIMMVFQELDSPISIPEQDLQLIGKTRNGFTVVEWGGKKVNRTTIF